MIDRIRAFVWGMIEFRSDFTRHYDGDLIETYDAGRDLAHRLTLRRFDPTWADDPRNRRRGA